MPDPSVREARTPVPEPSRLRRQNVARQLRKSRKLMPEYKHILRGLYKADLHGMEHQWIESAKTCLLASRLGRAARKTMETYIVGIFNDA